MFVSFEKLFQFIQQAKTSPPVHFVVSVADVVHSFVQLPYWLDASDKQVVLVLSMLLILHLLNAV